MILMIDNYDSFTYNLVQYLGILGQSVKVFRNDKIGIEQMADFRPKGIIISPGPGRPAARPRRGRPAASPRRRAPGSPAAPG